MISYLHISLDRKNVTYFEICLRLLKLRSIVALAVHTAKSETSVCIIAGALEKPNVNGGVV
jgi:hypothetical protein